MAADSTKLIIEIETLLRGLNKSLQGLNRIEKQIRTIASLKVSPQSQQKADRAAIAAQRLAIQQQRLSVQSQELANRQERARQASERLALSQQRLTAAQQRATEASKGLNVQQDAHVRVFRAAQQAAQQFNRQMTALGNSLRSVGQGLTSFGATLSISVSAPLAALGVGVVDAAVRMDSLKRGLMTIAGSAEEAAKQLERLTEIAKLPGIGFEEAIQGSIALQAVGFSAQEAEKALIQFSNAVALTGGSREQLQTITVQLGQMAAQSKVLAADLKPIINAAPAVAVALRNAFGTTRSEEIQELGVQSKEFIDILIKELAKLPRAAGGARNAFDNFQDTVFRAAATIGNSLLPALVRLADTFGPIITGLANAFAALPAPIQSTVLVVGALVVALGPFTFIFGQLITGLGRVVVGFAQLNALGLLPTIANFRLLGQVMIGTASLAQGAAATAAAAALGWATLAGAVVAVIGIAAAIATLSQRTKEQTETTEEQVRATEASLKVLRAQRDTLSKVTAETEAVATASDELKTIYKSLNKESQGRVTLLQREVGFTRALKDEIARLITVREGEQRIQAASLAASIATTAEQVQSLGTQLDAALNRVERLRKAREELVRTGRLPQTDPFLSSIASLDAVKRLEQLDKKIRELTDGAGESRKQIDDLTESIARSSGQLQQLEEATGKSTREILQAAKEYGFFKGDVDTAAKGIEAFRDAQVKLEAALSGTTEEVIRQRLELRKLSGPADEAQKQRRLLIDAAVDFARENSNTIDEAKKKLEEFAEKFPEVRKAIEDEKRKGPIEEFLREFTGRKKAGRQDSGTSLRNAQQQLADALVQIALASSEREIEIQKDKDAALLRAAETGQRLRIISYREFLELRSNLAAADLDREIKQQTAVVQAARNAQLRLLAESRKAGIPAAERTRREAQAAAAQEEAIRAEGRLKILSEQRERVESELAQEIKLSQDEQLKTTRQLEIQYAELQGRIEDALKAATVEEFREQLEDLGKAQDFLNKQINEARRLRKAEVAEGLEQERRQNQRKIDAIHNSIRQRDALAELAAAEKLVENAKDRQKRLEDDLTFQVQFRGLSEEESIRRRLEGEKKLQASMELAQSIIEQTRQTLIDLGVTPPPDLKKFLDAIETEKKGLAELTFPEQFRLAEKEFTRLNDERLRRIADVERAVNNRNIAEAEGLLLIRRINGEYVGDLQQQLDLLKQIAAASGDANLQRQAQSAEETVKDANDRLADFNKQLRSTTIDSLRSGFIDFFQNLRDSTISAKDRLLNLIDSVVNRINEVIAENLFDDLMASLFGGENSKGGILAGIKRLFGFEDAAAGGAGGAVAGGVQSSAASTALTTGATTAATTLQAGATTAAATLQTGAVTAAATDTAAATGFAAAIGAAAASFAAAVTAAGAAFAAAVAAAAASQAATQAASGLGALGGAATGLFPAVPGGIYKVLEGGYPEAVLTTDPKYAPQQVQILRKYLVHTRNLWGRVKSAPELAEGAFISRRDAESNLLSSLNFSRGVESLSSVSLEPISSPPSLNVRNINLIDKRDMVRGYLRSSEGVRDIVNVISENAPEIGRRIGVK